jgi:hypothetical protein
MTLTNFPNGVSSFGVPVMGGIAGIPMGGRWFFVNGQSGRGADGNDGTPESPLATLPGALDRCRAGNNDVVIVMANGQASGSARLSETLEWNKDSTHLIGMTAPTNVGQRARIATTSDATVFTPMVNVVADGCAFLNFSTFYGFADDSAQVLWLDEGERNYYGNVHFGGFGAQLAADHVGSRCLVLGAAGAGRGEHLFEGCTLGLDTVERAAANATLEIIGGSPRITFRRCMFIMVADADAPNHILIPAAGIDRWLLIDNCVQNVYGTAQAVGNVFGQGAAGNVIWKNSTSVNATDIAAAGTFFVDGGAPTAGTSGIAVENT